MAINPCIANTNCIDLSVNESSNLVATLVISDAAGNCAECVGDGLYVPCGDVSADSCNAIEQRADGLWVGDQFQQSFGVSIAETTTGAITSGDGLVVVREGTLAFSNPSTCNFGIILGTFNWGPLQINDLSAGGRATVGCEKHTGGGYVGGPYGLLENTGSTAQDFAWTGAWTTTVDPILASATGTYTWRQTVQLTAGSCSSVTLRSVAIYAWVVALA